jgi:hypothetical protein
MACPVRLRERLRGGGVEVARSRAVRVGFEGAVDMRSYKAQGWCGGVPSPLASTASGMVMQWPGWRCGGGVGRTGLMATEVTAPTVLASWRHPVRVRSSRASSLQGFRRHFSRVRCADRTGVGGTVSRGGC